MVVALVLLNPVVQAHVNSNDGAGRSVHDALAAHGELAQALRSLEEVTAAVA